MSDVTVSLNFSIEAQYDLSLTLVLMKFDIYHLTTGKDDLIEHKTSQKCGYLHPIKILHVPA